jgi:hypothetical protein
MRRALSLLFLALLCLGGGCGKETDEEILKERIDTTSVHLYLASKIAILKSDQSPEAKAAFDEVQRAIAAAQGREHKDGTPRLEAGDLLELGKALYDLRAEGKELLESGNEKGMQPILPKLFEPPPELAKMLDLNLEHALLLGGLFGLRFHPKSPAPVPDEILLYEAWMTKPADLPLPGVRRLFHGIKTVVYGQNELCDLALAESDRANAPDADATKLEEALSIFSGEPVKITEANDKQFDGAIGVITHGSCAQCFMKRDEKEKGLAELDKMAASAEDLGVPPGETALVRGYVAFERGDRAGAKKFLETARDHPGRTPEAKKDIEELLANLEDDEMSDYFGKGFFAVFAARLAVRELDRAGVFDDLGKSDLGKTLDGYLGATSEALGKASSLVPSTKGCLGG